MEYLDPLIWLKAFFWSYFAFVTIYYRVARMALDRLGDEDPEAYRTTGAIGGISARNSFAIIKILFDKSLPKDFYSSKLKMQLLAARAMLVIGSAMFVLLMSLTYSQPV